MGHWHVLPSGSRARGSKSVEKIRSFHHARARLLRAPTPTPKRGKKEFFFAASLPSRSWTRELTSKSERKLE
jgi:hypothetical protein